jgi:DNA repair exonuclease SbcCD nuclease subunit
MKLLLVGDYHAEPSDLEDCRRLADLIIRVASENKAKVVFMGDQYHTHAIIHAEVQLFWIQTYIQIHHKAFGSISLVGNHDKPGSAHSKASAMLAHRSVTSVVNEPKIVDSLLFLPYYDDPEEFIKVCDEHKSIDTVLCHQTFNGAAYDNGFYDKNGVDPNLIPQKLVISGHIHIPQKFSKVWYIGAPRWRTLSDANIDRAIWLVDFNTDGTINKTESFDTGGVCRQIYSLEDRQGGPAIPQHLDPAHEWRVDIHGTADYIEQRSTLLRAMGAKVRTFRVDLEQPKVKESEGISTAFEKWVDDYQPQHGTDKDTLKTLLKERIALG